MYSDYLYEEAMEDVHIVKRLSSNTHVIRLFGKEHVMKVITKTTHPWKVLLPRMGLSNYELLDRVANNYAIFERNGLGCKVLVQKCIRGRGTPCLVLFMDYLHHPATTKLNEEHSDKIEALIEKMHNLGIYHGDLHGENIMYNEEMEPIFLDLDTVFYREEIDSSPIPKVWAREGFNMTVEELIEYEKKENYRLVPE